MEMIRPGYAVVYVILLCALANGGSHGKRWNPEEFINDGSPTTSFHQDADKVQEAWKHCMEELIEKNIVKETESLPPQTQQILLDCMRTKTSNVAVSEEKAGSRPLLTKYLTTSDLGRHLLADSPSSSPSSSSSSSSSSSPSPSSSPASSSSPSPTSDDEKPADSSSKDNSFDSNLPPNMFAPFPPPPRRPPSPPRLPPPKPLVYAPPEPKHDDFQVQLIVFVVAVAVCAISAIILMYICCGKQENQKVDPKEAHKDDSPLLTVSSADHTFAASEKFSGLKNSDKRESSTMVRNMSAKPEEHSSLAETSSSGGIGQVPTPPLKPPPEAPPPPGPAPPPAPRAPPPPRGAKAPPVPKPMHGRNKSSDQGSMSDGGDSDKPKLKPFFWDKVNAKADQGMVWHQINAGSFQFNEEMIESLFGCANQNKNERKRDEPGIQYIQVIDPRKAQNLSILLRALNVTTEEVIDALKQGNEIPVEIIHTLLRMAPTQEEELKLRLFKEELNRLGPAERFLKVLVDIPFAFKRLESLMFMGTLPEEASNLKDYFATLEVACNKLRKSRLFLKLLEAVLKTGNRMNDGTYRGGAQAFKIDTLLKLSDVKGIDGKTTLLHFVVLEIIRSEGVRAVRAEKGSQPSIGSVKTEDFHEDHHTNEESAADHYRRLGLQVVSGLSGELEDVKKAAVIDGEGITASVSKLGQSLLKSKEFLNNEMKGLDEDSEFHRSLKSFVEKAEEEVTWLLEEEKRIMALVKNTGDYFHGTAGKDEGLRLFVVVRDFLVMLDKACKEVQDTTMKASKASKKETQTTTATTSPKQTRQPPENDIHRRLFPTIAGRRVGFSDSDSDSDDESLSP